MEKTRQPTKSFIIKASKFQLMSGFIRLLSQQQPTLANKSLQWIFNDIWQVLTIAPTQNYHVLVIKYRDKYETRTNWLILRALTRTQMIANELVWQISIHTHIDARTHIVHIQTKNIWCVSFNSLTMDNDWVVCFMDCNWHSSLKTLRTTKYLHNMSGWITANKSAI